MRLRPAIRLLGVVLVVSFLLLFSSLTVNAEDKYWVGDSGSWDESDNWSLIEGGPGGAGYPQVEDDVFIVQSDDVDRTVYFTSDLYSSGSSLKSFTIDATGTGEMTFSQSDGSQYSHYSYIGYDGTGTVVQTGGGWESNFLYLGYNPGSSGTYHLIDGQAGVYPYDQAYIGYSGSSTVIQTGGHFYGGQVILGNNPGSSGTYHLIDGVLSCNYNNIIGVEGNATFVQTGGVHKGGWGFTIGSQGNYIMDGGELDAGYTNFYGTLIQNGGFVSLAYLGLRGDYYLNGGYLGVGFMPGYDSGTFTQTGGEVHVDSRVWLANPDVIYNLEGGSLSIGPDSNEIDNFRNSGTFNYNRR